MAADRLSYILITVIMLTSSVFSARAADDLTATQLAMRRKLIFIEVSAETKLGSSLQATGTGFVIGPQRVLTTYHIFTVLEQLAAAGRLGEIVDGSVKIVGHVGAKASLGIPLELVKIDKKQDVLVLGLPTRAEGPYESVCAGADDPAVIKAPVATAGFPKFIPHITDTGYITSLDGPNGTWLTDLVFNEGQSGSPVFKINGELVGMAKGQLSDGDKAVPGVYVVLPLVDLPQIPRCQQGVVLRETPEKATETCIQDGLAQFSREDVFRIVGGARAPGPGPQFSVVSASEDICYNAPPGAVIVGQVQIKDLGNNAGRGRVGPAVYNSSSPPATGVCVKVDAWSEKGPFTGGGWQNAEIAGRIQMGPTDADRRSVEQACQKRLRRSD